MLAKLASLIDATPVGDENTFSDPDTQAPDWEEDIKAMEVLDGCEREGGGRDDDDSDDEEYESDNEEE